MFVGATPLACRAAAFKLAVHGMACSQLCLAACATSADVICRGPECISRVICLGCCASLLLLTHTTLPTIVCPLPTHSACRCLALLHAQLRPS